ncbi:MAG: hypothetical protein M3Z75_11345 [Actinomycetota bacterium]|nr:hypothetical protein [Actinomycetota bacterium]
MTQPYGLASKRWAQRANAIQFGELAAIRATAGQWRNGLAGLTALLSAGTLLASPTLASHLDPGPQPAVGLLAVAGLLALLSGTWRAMDAAFGVPAKEQYITGEWLQNWEHEQADQAVEALTVARWAFLAGLLLTIAAAATAYGFASSATGTLARVQTRTGAWCGQLGSAGPSIPVTGADGTVHLIDPAAIRAMKVETSC